MDTHKVRHIFGVHHSVVCKALIAAWSSCLWFTYFCINTCLYTLVSWIPFILAIIQTISDFELSLELKWLLGSITSHLLYPNFWMFYLFNKHSSVCSYGFCFVFSSWYSYIPMEKYNASADVLDILNFNSIPC